MRDFQITHIPYFDQTHSENQHLIKKIIGELGGPLDWTPSPYGSPEINSWRIYVKNGEYDGWDPMEHNTYEDLPEITFSDYLEHEHKNYTPPPPPTIEEVFKF